MILRLDTFASRPFQVWRPETRHIVEATRRFDVNAFGAGQNDAGELYTGELWDLRSL